MSVFAIVLLSAFVLAPLLPIHGADAQTFARVGALSLDPFDGYGSSSVVDPAAGFAYFGIVDNNAGQGSIVRIRLSDFSRAGRLTLNPGEINTVSVIDAAAGFAYFGTQSDIVKIRLSNFTRVGTLALNPGEAADSFVIDTPAGFAYLGTGTDPGLVVKVRLSDFTRVGTLALKPGESYLSSAVLDPSAGFAYFGTSGGPVDATSPGVIVKIRLSNFTRVGSITLNPSEYNLFPAVLDPLGGFAYFGTGGCSHPPPWQTGQTCAFFGVVKVRLSDFTRVGTLSMDNWPISSVIDSASGFAYFGTHSSPGVVVKVRLSDFTRVGSIILLPGEEYPCCAVFDSSSGSAYFGTGGFPAKIIKVEIAPPIVPYHPPSLFDQFVWWAPYLSVATGVAILVGVIIIANSGRHVGGRPRLTEVTGSVSSLIPASFVVRSGDG